MFQIGAVNVDSKCITLNHSGKRWGCNLWDGSSPEFHIPGIIEGKERITLFSPSSPCSAPMVPPNPFAVWPNRARSDSPCSPSAEGSAETSALILPASTVPRSVTVTWHISPDRSVFTVTSASLGEQLIARSMNPKIT